MRLMLKPMIVCWMLLFHIPMVVRGMKVWQKIKHKQVVQWSQLILHSNTEEIVYKIHKEKVHRNYAWRTKKDYSDSWRIKQITIAHVSNTYDWPSCERHELPGIETDIDSKSDASAGISLGRISVGIHDTPSATCRQNQSVLVAG